jgi:hypothetical protein
MPLPAVKVVHSNLDVTAVTKLVEAKKGEREGIREIEEVYTPHVYAEYEIMEEKLSAGAKLELVPSTHSLVLDLLQLQIPGRVPKNSEDSAFSDEIATFEHLQMVPKRELADCKNRIAETRKGKFLYIGSDDPSAVEDYFNRLLHFWQYQRAHQEPHKVTGFLGSEVSRFEANFQGNLNRVKQFKRLKDHFRFYAPYWIVKLDPLRFLTFDLMGAEQTRLAEELTNNPMFYDFIRSRTLSVDG